MRRTLAEGREGQARVTGKLGMRHRPAPYGWNVFKEEGDVI